ncbi:hypothetical protein GOP47_0008311 [Adiantum capillus-veneris]|uniref:Uncharacterized protein n=1 Tax=Adiantum capillus-veneris TaxID=13818 RepID=A0A9D4UY63_ADICA|nr:hypothetical protein GOP47_0008311 [Adiantum capillus-veneris]
MNTMNRGAHFQSTGPEIWKDTARNVDIFMAQAGTDDTFSGAGQFLKEQNPDIKGVARVYTRFRESLAKEEGLLAGISSSAVVAAALNVSKRPENAVTS